MSSPAHALRVPQHADGVQLIGPSLGSGYREPPHLVRRSDGQVLQLTGLLYAVLAAIDGQRDLDGIADEAGHRTGRLLSAEQVERLVTEQLLPLGLLTKPDGTQPAVKRSQPLLSLRFKYAVTDPDRTSRLTRPFTLLFHPVVVALVVAAFVAICWWVGWQKGLAAATHQAFYAPGLLLLVVAITALSAGFHEFGHAAGAQYGGARPGVMGAGLYLVWPAFYTDVTDSYRLGRGGRLRTDLGGLYFNAIVTVGIFGIWLLSGWDFLLLVVLTQVVQMLRQLAPLVRFDGYHVLADLTGVPDLYHQIKPILRGFLPWRRKDPRSRALKPWVHGVVVTWVLVFVPLMVAGLALSVLAFPRIAATAWDSGGRRFDSLQAAYGDGDWVGMGSSLLAMVAIALPVLGLVYLVVRMVRRVVRSVWRKTTGRPVLRSLAVVTGLAVLASLAWAWWPRPDQYRPIAAYESGTLADLLASSATSSASGLQAGRVSTAYTLWPQSHPLPTRSKPTLAVVLVPHDSNAQQGKTVAAQPDTWVFPFDRPPAPQEGDTQALAVNTTDGTIVYDVAFALVWAESGEAADNVNSAYALASCTGCAAVAVSFQVLLVVGEVNQVVPQNLAAAVNYNCIACVTYALAKQLVVTIDGPLSDEAMAKLEALWQEVAAFGAGITDVPLDQIEDQLQEYEDQILAIIEEDKGPLVPATDGTPLPSSSPGSPTPSGSPDGSPTGLPSESPTGAGSNDAPDSSPSGTTSPSSPGSPGTSGSPGSTAPSPEPTPSDTPSPSESTTGP